MFPNKRVLLKIEKKWAFYKKILVLIMILLVASTNSQEEDSSLKLHSANVGFGGFYTKNNFSESGGATFFVGVTTIFNKNLISTTYITGAEIALVGSSTLNFNELKLEYGRELQLAHWLFLGAYAGVGYYSQKSDVYTILSDNVMSFPLRMDIKFYFNRKLGIGINTNYSINKLNNNLSINLMFHYSL